VLALSAVDADVSLLAPSAEHLLDSAFDEQTPPQRRRSKLLRGLNEIHLVSLKADFELYLNRSLTAVWTAHFESLTDRVPSEPKVSLQQLAASIANEERPGTATGREFVIGQVVPGHGLDRLVRALKKVTEIDVPSLLNRHDIRRWPQLLVAFEVRHLVEHRDGKVDSVFRAKVREVWSNSSWKDRNFETLTKIAVESADVHATHDAMVQAVRLVTEAVCRWNAQQSSTGIPAVARRPRSRPNRQVKPTANSVLRHQR